MLNLDEVTLVKEVWDMLTEGLQMILQRLTEMKWSDYLDILLVAYLFYRLLPLIHSNSAMRVVRVVATLLVIAWITDLAEMNTLNFLLNQVLTVGIIALVVLFQPELRRTMDHLGNVKLGSVLAPKKAGPELHTVIAQTVMACEIMSREKVGALIVFARENPMDEFFKTGTMIDGQVSEQLIRNIFFPKASLHAGAMIVCNGRVPAAGCVLPLSENTRISADLGTRHRAGLGISEATDAVTIIVSEETGTISVAVGGMLKRHLAPQTLERLLRNELCPEEPEKKPNIAVMLRQKFSRKGADDDEE